MPQFEIGSLVRVREREWIVLPSPRPDLLLLRPLGGSAAETCGVYLPIEGRQVQSATFAPPDPDLAGDAGAGSLLRDAARLSLRSGAGPFRALGRIDVRPRPYQFVPLIMALRLDPVRLLIADDVGIGKTIEAGLIVRELLDRGEIRRFTVLCPPHLCDQWQRELATRFALDAVIVRASTAAALERSLPPHGDVSIFEHYPITVASIDYVKSDRRRDSFVRACPELVIVDEAHTATQTTGRGTAQQQRHALVHDIAAHAARHLLLLTATPHSGIAESFRSLLGLLAPGFATLDLHRLAEAERADLARHFVQRRRADVQRWLGADDVTPFPIRESAEVTYTLARSSAYRTLFDDIYTFTRELVREQWRDTSSQVRRRARYWAALALLRCVMSSPAAAEKALKTRAEATTDRQDVDLDVPVTQERFSSYVADTTDQEHAQDLEPTEVVAALTLPLDADDPLPGASTGTGPDKRGDRARLNRFAVRARDLAGAHDPKLQQVLAVLVELLRDGFNPIVYCRYIATANYLAAELAAHLTGYGTKLRILAVTGERSEEERESLVAELEASPRRLLVATDCLSEGINLQGAFDAVIHYDLPWNPNRLEQREGRVDRYGQRASRVRTVLLYGQDNPMDAAVMQVLLRKAVSIHRTLGISVPLPVDSTTVVETLIASLFQPAAEQMSLFDAEQQAALADAESRVQGIERQWAFAVEREQESRTRFAQRRIKPEEVARELDETDAVLGDPATVERFVVGACERLGAPLTAAPLNDFPAHRAAAPGDAADLRVFTLQVPPLPRAVQERVAPAFAPQPGATPPAQVPITFATPAPEGVISIGRNHPLTAALADYLLELALVPEAGQPPAARSGLIRTRGVSTRTTLLLLRVRMLIETRPQAQKTADSPQINADQTQTHADQKKIKEKISDYQANQRHQRAIPPMLAEELLVCGYTGRPGALVWLDEAAALALLEQAQPAANVTPDERRLGIQRAVAQLPDLQADINAQAQQRAERLRAAHQRVRAQTQGGRVTVRPHLPPDVLGIYLLLPVPG
jgi:superfamily II DNA or RNA helicase